MPEVDPPVAAVVPEPPLELEVVPLAPVVPPVLEKVAHVAG